MGRSGQQRIHDGHQVIDHGQARTAANILRLSLSRNGFIISYNGWQAALTAASRNV
jgi:hypothetical protein